MPVECLVAVAVVTETTLDLCDCRACVGWESYSHGVVHSCRLRHDFLHPVDLRDHVAGSNVPGAEDFLRGLGSRGWFGNRRCRWLRGLLESASAGQAILDAKCRIIASPRSNSRVGCGRIERRISANAWHLWQAQYWVTFEELDVSREPVDGAGHVFVDEDVGSRLELALSCLVLALEETLECWTVFDLATFGCADIQGFLELIGIPARDEIAMVSQTWDWLADARKKMHRESVE
jgi:hypothetical protein